MRVVLDASAGVEIALRGVQAARLETAVGEAQVVLAPDLLVAEVVNTFWKLHRLQGLSAAACDQGIEDALGLVDDLVPCGQLVREAFLMARVAQRPAYEMFYLALARRAGATLATLDGKLRQEAERQGVAVV